MKKRNLKNLALNKISVSNLTGGADSVDTNPTITGPTITILNSNDFKCTTWYSELYTACHCETLQETCGLDCETIHNPSN